MASTSTPANDENPLPVKRRAADDNNASTPRRPLGEVSANVKVSSASQTPNRFTKPDKPRISEPLTGSPLKRSFTAAMEGGGGGGWTYLKKRRLGELAPLSLSGREAAAAEGRVFGSEEAMSLTMSMPYVVEPSPTEPNTPSASPSPSHGNDEGSSEERKSFSSLINYDPSSQSQLQPQTAANISLSNLSSTSLFKSPSTAELLKLRLRVAMYKVRTNQTSVPFLELPDPEHARRMRQREEQLSANAAVEEAVAELRREARMVQERDAEVRRLRGEEKEEEEPPVLHMGLGPVLRPTAYSSRFIYEQEEMPSSPRGGSPDKLSSLPVAVGEEASTPRRGLERLARPEEAELTSSVVKEKVVQGLLGLRNGV